MSNYYDRDGKPMTLTEWSKAVEKPDAKRVAEDTLPNGMWVSTVWLGIDHNYSDTGSPIIFETMVFPSKDGPLDEQDVERYATESEAVTGHKAMVAKWAE